MDEKKIIETERLTLREMSEDDGAFMLELLNDPDFIRNIADRGVRSLDGARAYISERFVDSYRQHGFGLWLVESKEDGAPAGMCGLLKRKELNVVEVGYAFLPSFRSKGFAFESASASKTYARDVLGLKQLHAVVNPDNAGSIRVLEKLGMRFERMVRLAPDGPQVRLYAVDL